MDYRTDARIIYGQSIRERAEWLLEAHGPNAETVALEAAHESGAAVADRAFWDAVAARITRQLQGPRVPDLPNPPLTKRSLPEQTRPHGPAGVRGYVQRAVRPSKVPPVSSAPAE